MEATDTIFRYEVLYQDVDGNLQTAVYHFEQRFLNLDTIREMVRLDFPATFYRGIRIRTTEVIR